MSHPYDFKKIGQVHKNCPECQRSNFPEPGFYQGAMYVSYGFGVALYMGLFIAMNILFPDLGMKNIIIVMSVLFVLLAPLTFAYSKITWAKINFSKKEE